MNIQIIGTKKDFDTQKALRFFKERGMKPQFRDLKEKALSPGELRNITKSVPAEELVDPESKEYKKRGYAYMTFDPVEEILERPLLMKMPVVRSGGKAAVGYAPETWEGWLDENDAE